MIPIEYRPADAFAVDELVATLNRCFAGYLVPVHFDRKAIFQIIRTDSVDLSASIVIEREGLALGVGLIARRGWNSRLASMCIDPKFRRQQLGTQLTQFLIRSARERGDRHLALETI